MNHSGPKPETQNRREMCRSALRYLALGGITVLSAGLIVRRTASSAPASCRRSLSCRECAAFDHCRLRNRTRTTSDVQKGTVPFSFHENRDSPQGDAR